MAADSAITSAALASSIFPAWQIIAMPVCWRCRPDGRQPTAKAPTASTIPQAAICGFFEPSDHALWHRLVPVTEVACGHLEAIKDIPAGLPRPASIYANAAIIRLQVITTQVFPLAADRGACCARRAPAARPPLVPAGNQRRAIRNERYRCLPITWYYWPMVIRRDEYLVTTARDLGAALKHFRTAAGVTQVAAAEAMGIGQPYLSSLEGGKFGSSLTHALRLLRFIGCEVIVRPREPRG